MGNHNKKQEYADQMEAIAKKVLKVIGFVILGITVVIGIGFVVKWLWNSLMPELFGLKEITYWQGVGILILSKIFFGGISSNSSSKNCDSNSGKVKGVIGKAIHEEMQQEFYKEYEKKQTEEHSTSENIDQDKLYEKWWAEEGEKKFEDYLEKIEKDE
jgi:hypothetical protein